MRPSPDGRRDCQCCCRRPDVKRNGWLLQPLLMDDALGRPPVSWSPPSARARRECPHEQARAVVDRLGRLGCSGRCGPCQPVRHVRRLCRCRRLILHKWWLRRLAPSRPGRHGPVGMEVDAHLPNPASQRAAAVMHPRATCTTRGYVEGACSTGWETRHPGRCASPPTRSGLSSTTRWRPTTSTRPGCTSPGSAAGATAVGVPRRERPGPGGSGRADRRRGPSRVGQRRMRPRVGSPLGFPRRTRRRDRPRGQHRPGDRSAGHLCVAGGRCRADGVPGPRPRRRGHHLQPRWAARHLLVVPHEVLHLTRGSQRPPEDTEKGRGVGGGSVGCRPATPGLMDERSGADLA